MFLTDDMEVKIKILTKYLLQTGGDMKVQVQSLPALGPLAPGLPHCHLCPTHTHTAVRNRPATPPSELFCQNLIAVLSTYPMRWQGNDSFAYGLFYFC